MTIAADLKEWDAAKYRENVVANTTLDALNVDDADGEMMDMLRQVTEGASLEMVDAVSCAGEAWFQMSERYYSKTIH